MQPEEIQSKIEAVLRTAADEDEAYFELEQWLTERFEVDGFLVDCVIFVGDGTRFASVAVIGFGWFDCELKITAEQEEAILLRVCETTTVPCAIP